MSNYKASLAPLTPTQHLVIALTPALYISMNPRTMIVSGDVVLARFAASSDFTCTLSLSLAWLHSCHRSQISDVSVDNDVQQRIVLCNEGSICERIPKYSSRQCTVYTSLNGAASDLGESETGSCTLPRNAHTKDPIEEGGRDGPPLFEKCQPAWRDS